MAKTKKRAVKPKSFGMEVLQIAQKAVKQTLAESSLLLKLQKIRTGK
jgi:hypothetical protein